METEFSDFVPCLVEVASFTFSTDCNNLIGNSRNSWSFSSFKKSIKSLDKEFHFFISSLLDTLEGLTKIQRTPDMEYNTNLVICNFVKYDVSKKYYVIRISVDWNCLNNFLYRLCVTINSNNVSWTFKLRSSAAFTCLPLHFPRCLSQMQFTIFSPKSKNNLKG